jgi:2-phospho-L-lactate guanylyltransferase
MIESSGNATWIVIPVKRLESAKQRLAPVLPAQARRELALAMLRDVLEATTPVRGIRGVAVVTPDERLRPVCTAHGATWLGEETVSGMNAAVAHAARVLEASGVARTVVIPADLPAVSVAAVERVLAEITADVAIVRDRRGRGTNMLACRPPSAVRPRFGTGSFAAHIEAAWAHGLAPQEIHSPPFVSDVDTPEDLLALRRGACGRNTGRWIEHFRAGIELGGDGELAPSPGAGQTTTWGKEA